MSALLEPFFDQALAVFGQAAADTQTRDHCVAGAPVRVTYASRALAGSLDPALSTQLAVPLAEGEPPVLSIYAWSGDMPGGRLPPPPWEALDFFERGNVRGYQSARYNLVYDRRPEVFSAFDAERRLGLYWARDQAAMQYAELAAPMRRLFQAWLQTRGRLVLHAAGVSTPAGGALLAGRTGSGKSTTAAACASAGLGYAGDDYMVVEAGAEPRAYGLYRSLKLNREMLAWLPELAPRVSNAEQLASEKALVYWPAATAGAAGFPLRALVLPRRTPHTASLARPLAPEAAYRALLPDTLFTLLGDAKHVTPLLRRLVNTLPCFELALGSDLRQLVAVITELISSAANSA